VLLAAGCRLLRGYLDPAMQHGLVAALRQVLLAAPWFTPRMPRTGRPFSVRMSNCGELGWVSDRQGYRYQAHHPATGAPWPPMPGELLRIWNEAGGYTAPPQACLINHYTGSAKMGLHRDEDEEDLDAPVVSISLGDECRFRLGGPARRGPTQSFKLSSGDVLVLGGESRLAYHGVDRIYAGSSTLFDGQQDPLPGSGRINLTLRRVTPPR
jgi:alkylated DNA repair protein (DNA oxidative demethylase)